MELAIAVLAVGSLYWDSCPIRQEWQRLRLKMDEVSDISTAIRYGRRSQKRQNTFTMVFSRSCLRGCFLRSRLGRAKAIRCQRPVRSVQDLIDEAEALWDAEDPNQQPSGRLSKSFGCVALLINPNSQIPQLLIDGWADRVENEPNYGHFSKTDDEESVVCSRGFLRLPWPNITRTRRPLPFDLVLATPTNPTLEGHPLDYPTPSTIAKAWNQASPECFDYFKNNRTNQIHTFQDRQIKRHLKPELREAARQAQRTS
jgi:hypothetical protein